MPQALDRATVAGDPCFDRMRASVHLRGAYRSDLGAHGDETVVVVSSTWGGGSLFGRRPDLLDELVAELPLDDHVVAAVLHPNLWFAHGRLQVRHWLGDALRSGLRLVPAARGWQQAVLAADVVVGDHGAVTGYAAACGVPTVLATFPKEEVAPGSVIDVLGARTPLLERDVPLCRQLRQIIAEHDSADADMLAELTSSTPDRSAERLRALFYQLLRLPEPERTPLVRPYPADDLEARWHVPEAAWVDAAWVEPTVVELRRWPADVTARIRRRPRAADPHLMVHHDHPRRDLRGNASVVIVPRPQEWSGTDVDTELATILRERPGCRIAAAVDATGRAVILGRDLGRVTATPTGPADGRVLASAAYAWLADHDDQHWPPRTLTVRCGGHEVTAIIT